MTTLLRTLATTSEDRTIRFASILEPNADPLGFEGGDQNLTRYVGNSPTNATDPSGLFIVPVFDPSMSEEERNTARERLMRLLGEIAEEDELSIGGCLARAALSERMGITVRVIFDPDLSDNAFGRNKKHSRKGEIRINPKVEFPDINDPNLNLQDENGNPLSADQMAKILLVHELGHAIGNLNDPTVETPLGGNVTLCENEYRRIHGYKLRGRYDRNVPLPTRDQVEDDGEKTIESIQRDFPHPNPLPFPDINRPPLER